MFEIKDLLIQCKDDDAKMYIEEAIKCYNAGAYRACINYTWLAVFTNIIYKTKELSDLGDNNAIASIDNLDTIISKNKIADFLKFEREILDNTSKNFQFIDEITLIDLKRLQEDRNRCSHPTFYKKHDELYQPSAYQARHHLFVSVDKLISENNVYGKEVIDIIFNELNSPYFPTQYDKIKNILENNYFIKPKDSLVSNLSKLLTKELLGKNLDDRKTVIYQETLRFLLSKYRGILEESLFNRLDSIVKNNPLRYKNLHKLLSIDEVLWSLLSDGNKEMIKNYISQITTDDIECLSYYSNISELSEVVSQKVEEFKSNRNIQLVSFQNATDSLKQDIIDKYLNSGNFDTANSLVNSIVEILQEFDKEKISEFLVKAYQNSQITASHEFKRTLLPNLKELFSDEEIENIKNQAHKEAVEEFDARFNQN